MAERIFPRIPESNWWDIREKFALTLPSQVTPSYLQSLLSLTNEQSARNLISPLKQLGIIGDDGKPTPRANDWRSDDKYGNACHEMIEAVYPQELRDLAPGPVVDKVKAGNWFRHTAKLGKAAAGKSAVMYALLHQGLPEGGVAKKARPAKPAPATRKTKQADSAAGREDPSSMAPSEPKGDANDVDLHIDLQIHISPEATAEQIDTIMASIAKHLYRR